MSLHAPQCLCIHYSRVPAHVVLHLDKWKLALFYIKNINSKKIEGWI